MSTRGAVFFDLDETLIDRQAGLRKFASRLWYEGLVTGLSEADFITEFIRIDDNGRAPGHNRFSALCAAHLPTLGPQALISRIRQEAWEQPILVADACEVLQSLAVRDYRIGIVSNGSSTSQRAKIRNSALRIWDAVTIVSGELDCQKPDPAIYQHALRQLGAVAEESWFVGDSAENDVLAPAALGLRPIWFQRQGHWPRQHPPAYVARVTRLAEVLDVIR